MVRSCYRINSLAMQVQDVDAGGVAEHAAACARGDAASGACVLVLSPSFRVAARWTLRLYPREAAKVPGMVTSGSRQGILASRVRNKTDEERSWGTS
jgi:glycogen synthase